MKYIICLYLQKRRPKDNIPADAGHFLTKEIDTKYYKNENLPKNIRKNKAEKPYLKKKYS